MGHNNLYAYIDSNIFSASKYDGENFSLFTETQHQMIRYSFHDLNRSLKMTMVWMPLQNASLQKNRREKYLWDFHDKTFWQTLSCSDASMQIIAGPIKKC